MLYVINFWLYALYVTDFPFPYNGKSLEEVTWHRIRIAGKEMVPTYCGRIWTLAACK